MPGAIMECAVPFLGAIEIMGIAIDEFTGPIRIKLDILYADKYFTIYASNYNKEALQGEEYLQQSNRIYS